MYGSCEGHQRKACIWPISSNNERNEEVDDRPRRCKTRDTNANERNNRATQENEERFIEATKGLRNCIS